MTGIDHQPLEIRLLYHRFQHFFPDALVSPATETPLDSIPLTIFRRQVSPWCSRSQNPEHAIQKLTGILCVPSPRSLVSYCVRLENFPHRIGHIVPSIAVLHEETPLCVFLHYTTKRHFCRQCLGGAYTGRPPLRQPAGRNGRTPDFLSTGPVQDALPCHAGYMARRRWMTGREMSSRWFCPCSPSVFVSTLI